MNQTSWCIGGDPPYPPGYPLLFTTMIICPTIGPTNAIIGKLPGLPRTFRGQPANL